MRGSKMTPKIGRQTDHPFLVLFCRFGTFYRPQKWHFPRPAQSLGCFFGPFLRVKNSKLCASRGFCRFCPKIGLGLFGLCSKVIF